MHQEVSIVEGPRKARRKQGLLSTTLLLTLVFTLILTACGSNSSNSNASEQPSSAQATQENNAPETSTPDVQEEQTRQVKHEYGESTIPAHPKRIVSIGLEDILLSLDVPLVQAFSSDGYYLDKQLKEKGIATNNSFDINVEAIMSADPDLIIINKYVTDEQGYEKLSKVAPTIGYIRDDWQQSLKDIGVALGKEEQAGAVLKTYQDKLSQAKASIVQAVGENKTVAFIRPTTKNVELDFPEWSWTSVLYNDLGLKPDAKVLEFQKNTEDTWGGTMLSTEALPQLTADYLFLDYGASLSNEDDFKQQVAQSEEVEKLNVWKAIPAVKNGQAHKVSARHWALSGPIADSLKVDDVLQALQIK
ncbi:ABC transporter substrate-binding protein [Cohnella abietis]|uniref:Iron ABC transporter substrate-binding protein n=1 Tax=Cohnella abietis TaxID=2507935 RepID=A0A3T1D652_9BACL|nr:ABC transporter substrate-binding protein [Cohnella abietis]BBI33560.1 iron ABC transporter substrate-binding protein [Cohnella abietis]